MQADLGLTEGDLGQLTMALFVGYGIGQLVFGALNDGHGPRWLLLIGMLTSAGLNIGFAFSRPITAFIWAGGIAGNFIAGWLSGARLGGRHAPIVVSMLALLAGLSAIFPLIPVEATLMLVIYLAAVGACTYAPDMLIVHTMAMEVATRKAAASACGFINFFGRWRDQRRADRSSCRDVRMVIGCRSLGRRGSARGGDGRAAVERAGRSHSVGLTSGRLDSLIAGLRRRVTGRGGEPCGEVMVQAGHRQRGRLLKKAMACLDQIWEMPGDYRDDRPRSLSLRRLKNGGGLDVTS